MLPNVKSGKMLNKRLPFPSSPHWHTLHETYRRSEKDVLNDIMTSFDKTRYPVHPIEEQALRWIKALRSPSKSHLTINKLLNTYTLDTPEGRALMVLAEALLRIPDKATRENLIREKLTSTGWYDSAQKSESFLIQMAGFSLDISKHLMTLGQDTAFEYAGKLAQKLSNPVIRGSVIQGIHQMGDTFILGKTMGDALKKIRHSSIRHQTYSFDMLGEAAVCFQDADHYFEAYKNAIIAAGNFNNGAMKPHGVSVKLSALYPRYEALKRDAAVFNLTGRLLTLAQLASEKGINLTMDAEESERLTMSLEIFEAVYGDSSLKNYEGLGLAVQAYQKRAPAVIDWLLDLYSRYSKKIPLRLVKGAYWDREIKVAQEQGVTDFPVFTRKSHTDVCYLTCAQKILDRTDAFSPYFASHNAHTLSAISHMGKSKHYTLQRLQGMGEDVFDELLKDHKSVAIEVYAPVGAYKDVLAYLVRRLLENGANSSFVHKIYDKNIPAKDLAKDPFDVAMEKDFSPHSGISLPKNMFKDRINSKGMDLSDYPTLDKLKGILDAPSTPIPSTKIPLDSIMATTHKAFDSWSGRSVFDRARLIEKLGDALEHDTEILRLLCIEGKKTIADSISEVREAIDFCRYYSVQAKKLMGSPHTLPGPAGELNQLSYAPRGVAVCISPWNFPLAIFLGQVVAALVTGNTVVAKPSNLTPAIAAYAVHLAHKTGIPEDVLQLCTAPSSDMHRVLDHPAVTTVVFTGSTHVAKKINTQLADRSGPIISFIAETGGLNAMLVDSSALFEQVILDVMTSAFKSAGQRCSALRVLCLQDDIAEPLLELLINAMKALDVGDPKYLATDIGPVIDNGAKQHLLKQIEKLKQRGRLLYEHAAPQDGAFIPPQ
ncbi:MAG: proline dehydrogenase family protein, partial [Alphaproteobacteria bacterium]|nr:proline dehydrogenase family protein [Alphaproteobacteria bacterium]